MATRAAEDRLLVKLFRLPHLRPVTSKLGMAGKARIEGVATGELDSDDIALGVPVRALRLRSDLDAVNLRSEYEPSQGSSFAIRIHRTGTRSMVFTMSRTRT